jgi:hypothetical protein
LLIADLFRAGFSLWGKAVGKWLAADMVRERVRGARGKWLAADMVRERVRGARGKWLAADRLEIRVCIVV